jgi:ubiquinone/menaquinone biosynthesis C-methylase UbiE
MRHTAAMTERSITDLFLDGLALGGKRVIDVGCGAGELVRHMAQAGAKASGIDPNPARVAKARLGAGPGAEFIEARAESLPFDKASVDVVIFHNSLHHVPVEGMDAALAEAARVLKPGGVLAVSEPIARGPHFEAMKPVNDETSVRNEAIAAMARAVASGAFRAEGGDQVHKRSGVEKDFETFCAHMIETEPKRAALIQQMKDELRAAFERNAIRTPEGYAFDRFTRFNRFRRT